jgi:16S rRNA processing protein RimM
MPAPPWLLVGRVVAPFGVRGEMRVALETEFPERLARRPLYLGPERRLMRVERVRMHQRDALVKLASIETPEAAAELRGAELYIAQEDAAPLPPGRYYLHQIIGLPVWTTTGERYGEVRDVLSRPANDVYVVQHEGREVLMPAISDVVKAIDLDAGRIVIEVVPGLE